jgi:hypothetical protein
MNTDVLQVVALLELAFMAAVFTPAALSECVQPDPALVQAFASIRTDTFEDTVDVFVNPMYIPDVLVVLLALITPKAYVLTLLLKLINAPVAVTVTSAVVAAMAASPGNEAIKRSTSVTAMASGLKNCFIFPPLSD